MTDESFHLTALDIRRYDFGAAFRGYDKERVEQFRTDVAAEVERLSRQLAEMEAKARGFHEQLRAFRERDKALNDALIAAQQMRAETKQQAERESQLIIREAESQAAMLTEEARASVGRLQHEIDSLERMRRAQLALMKEQAARYLADIGAAEESLRLTAAMSASTAASASSAARPVAPQPSVSRPVVTSVPVVAPMAPSLPGDAPTPVPSYPRAMPLPSDGPSTGTGLTPEWLAVVGEQES